MLNSFRESFKERFLQFAYRHQWLGLWQAIVALVALGIAILAGFGYVVVTPRTGRLQEVAGVHRQPSRASA